MRPTMKIGITYDLRADYLAAGYTEEQTAEFDRPDTIEAIEGALRSLGYQTDRIGHVRHLVKRLADGDRWDFVFNIAEGLRGFGRESQVPCLLEAYDVPYTFSDPLVSALTLHKALTKRVLRDAGVPTTDFFLVEAEADIAKVKLTYPLFAKPVAEGTAKGIDSESKIDTPAQLDCVCRRLLNRFHEPVLVEPYLSGREFTTAILGTDDEAEAIGTMEVELLDGAEPHSYTYVNKEKCEELCRYSPAPKEWAEACAELSLAAWRTIGCRDGGRVDLRADAKGKLYVMELNPLPGIHPDHSDLPIIGKFVGIPYVEMIRRIVVSGLRRAPSLKTISGAGKPRGVSKESSRPASISR